MDTSKAAILSVLRELCDEMLEGEFSGDGMECSDQEVHAGAKTQADPDEAVIAVKADPQEDDPEQDLSWAAELFKRKSK